MKLKEALQDILSPSELQALVGSFDVVGTVAIIIIPVQLEAKEGLIADAILATHRNIRTVAKRAGTYHGEFRTIDLAVIAGEDLGETVHRESGVRFCLHPGKVYFSVRTGHERQRIAGLVSHGEEVLVMFSGIGAFPLILAAGGRAGGIVGVEKNPDAHSYAQKSLALNKKIKNVVFYQGDVRDVLPRLGRRFDRVIMPLPGAAENYLDLALAVCRPGGWLHFYDFQPKDAFSESAAKIARACSGRLQQTRIAVCGHCSPRNYRICVDAQVG
jgi:tRNA (guanine37-N1)-methyltransferase